MTRKDSEKDADRPHYYSQFWLDIAAGRRVIGGPRPEDAEANEAEILEPAPAPTRKASRSSATDGYKEARATAVVAPIVEEDEIIEPADEEFLQEDTVDEAELPTIALDETALPAEDEPSEEEEEFFDEEEEEDE